VTMQSSADMLHTFQTIAKETRTAIQIMLRRKMSRRKRPSYVRKSGQDYADKAFETRRDAGTAADTHSSLVAVPEHPPFGHLRSLPGG
jgi:hypothetical protein